MLSSNIEEDDASKDYDADEEEEENKVEEE
ncbi:hypothetical protein A2U01_0069815, partial [Trifolium medium]|nr:hypothetical protein [Trifolium medium]